MKNHPDLPESAPQWLRDADIEYPRVEIINGLVVWYDGDWYDGVWHDGEWYDGDWYDGVWHDGVWHDGLWHNGEWLGGKELAPRARWLFTKKDNILKIGCKQKTIQEWKEWFENSDEVFNSPRNSERFNLIKQAFYKFCAS